MNKHSFRKLATVGAAAALSLQLLSGVASAAVPNASSDGSTYGSFAGDGFAGFALSYHYADSSTLAKLYLKINIAGGEAIETFNITRDGSDVKGCSVSATLITCQVKTVRTGDDFDILLVVKPTATATEVRLTNGWSSTGFVEGGNNSHGDSWDLCQAGQLGCEVDADPATLNQLVSSRTGDDNTAAGFGNLSLNTSTTNLGGNGQAASLKNLPNGKYAYVNDNGVVAGNYRQIDLIVNGGETVASQELPTHHRVPEGHPYGPTRTCTTSTLDRSGHLVLTDTYTACAGATRATASSGTRRRPR